MDMKDQGSSVLVFPDTRGRFGREMFVTSTYVNIQGSAESFNSMLKTQLMYGIRSLSECGVNMAMAFFKQDFLLQAGHFVFEAP